MGKFLDLFIGLLFVSPQVIFILLFVLATNAYPFNDGIIDNIQEYVEEYQHDFIGEGIDVVYRSEL